MFFLSINPGERVGLLSRLIAVGLCCALSACATPSQTVPIDTEVAKTPETLSMKNARLGLKRVEKGQLDEAIFYFSKALQSNGLDANDHIAVLNNRGVVQKNLGQFQKAMQDFSEAIDLNPKQPGKALYNRGITRFFLGQFSESALDLKNFLDLHPENRSPYTFLWLYLAQKSAGFSAKETLIENRSFLSGFSWPGPLLSLHLDELSSHSLLDRVVSSDNERLRLEQLCDAYFHLGEYHLLKGEKTASERWFKMAVDTNMRQLNEYTASLAQLQRMQEQPILTEQKKTLPKEVEKRVLTRRLFSPSTPKKIKQMLDNKAFIPSSNLPDMVLSDDEGSNAFVLEVAEPNRLGAGSFKKKPEKQKLNETLQKGLKTPAFEVEIGFYRNPKTVASIASKVKSMVGLDVVLQTITTEDQWITRISVGSFVDRREAQKLLEILHTKGKMPGHVQPIKVELGD